LANIVKFTVRDQGKTLGKLSKFAVRQKTKLWQTGCHVASPIALSPPAIPFFPR
jgi:hypothetical protein